MPMRAKRKEANPDHYVNHVPNRDLDDDEYQALDPELRKLVRESGLWDVKTDAEMKGGSASAPKGGD